MVPRRGTTEGSKWCLLYPLMSVCCGIRLVLDWYCPENYSHVKGINIRLCYMCNTMLHRRHSCRNDTKQAGVCLLGYTTGAGAGGARGILLYVYCTLRFSQKNSGVYRALVDTKRKTHGDLSQWVMDCLVLCRGGVLGSTSQSSYNPPLLE